MAPVVPFAEAPQHPHNASRGTFVEVDGVVQPAPAPRFSRTPGAIRSGPAGRGENTEEALTEWGFDAGDLDRLRVAGAIK